ncbi:hypothetical protein PMAYCL1PPCAC_27907, partial [Pristionchus mayeri]
FSIQSMQSSNSSGFLPEQKVQSEKDYNSAVQNPLKEDQATGAKSPLSPSSLFSSADEESKATNAFSQALRRLRDNHPVTSSFESSLQQMQPENKIIGKPICVLPLSPASPFSCADEEFKETDAFCKAFRQLSTMDTHIDDSAIETIHAPDLSENPALSMIESLPWPALKRLFFFLFPTNGNCEYLFNLSQVSSHFHVGVHEFMKKNRPGIERVTLCRTTEGLKVEMYLFRSNIAFHGLDDLVAGRFERSME